MLFLWLTAECRLLYFNINQKNNTLEIAMPVTAQPSQKFSKRLLVVRMILELLESSRM
jgi:hypothetical protein